MYRSYGTWYFFAAFGGLKPAATIFAVPLGLFQLLIRITSNQKSHLLSEKLCLARFEG